MKKSLSVVLSTAMALSMFSSVAFGKTSTDFEDLKDLDAATKAKFDAMISAGIFDGVSDTSFGLKEEMNRAQFAKVAALIMGLEVDSTLTTSSFSDVSAEDPANGYALPYIEALKKAGVTDGYGEGTYNPAGKVTKQELATFLVRILGKDAEAKATPGVSDSTVDGWAQGYVALALKLNLLANNADGTFGGTSNATRDLLVTGAYETSQQYEAPVGAQVEVKSVEATDAAELTVNFNKAVDAVTADNFEVKRGSTVAEIKEVKLSDDKKSAIITLADKLIDAEYTVTASGIANLSTDKVSGTVTAEAEKITKIEFKSASDTISRAKVETNSSGAATSISRTLVEFEAINQYGKAADKRASDFEIKISSDDIESSIVNKSDATAFSIQVYEPQSATDGDNDLRNGDRFSITIRDDVTNIQTTKVFTVGDEAMVAKFELGDLVDKNGEKVDYIKAEPGEKAYLTYTAYDQYGMRVTDAATLNDDVNLSTDDDDVVAAKFNSQTGDVVSYDDDLPFVDDIDGDDNDDLQLLYVQDEDEKQVGKDITVTAYAGGTTSSKTIKVAAIKQPASIEIPAFNGVIAEGDEGTHGVAVPIVVKDANGTELTPQEIKDAAEKFDFDTSGAVDDDNSTGETLNGIIITGDDIGKLRVEGRKTGSGKITLSLKEKPEVTASLNMNVVAERHPDRIKWSDEIADKFVQGGGDTAAIKVYDQYGEEYDENYSEDDYAVRVYAEAVGNSSPSATLTVDRDSDSPDTDLDAYKTATQWVVGLNSTTPKNGVIIPFASSQNGAAYNGIDIFDNDLKFNSATEGNYKLKFDLLKVSSKGNDDSSTAVVDETGYTSAGTGLTKTVEVINNTADKINDLTYTAYLDDATTDNSILAFYDLIDGDGYSKFNTYTTFGTAVHVGTDADAATTDIYPDLSGAVHDQFMRAVAGVDEFAGKDAKVLAKKIKIKAVDNTGKEVGVDGASVVSGVYSDNEGIADAIQVGSDWYVIGFDEGTANLNVQFNTANGTDDSSITVKSVGTAPAVASMTLDNTSVGVSASVINAANGGTGMYVWDGKLGDELDIFDQFGGEYDLDDDAETLSGLNANLLGLTFSVNNIKYATGASSSDAQVVIDNSTGKVKINGTTSAIKSFTIKISSTSGKSVTLDVSLN